MDEHVHEWELGMEWSHFCDDPADFDGYILTCKYPDCDATIRESPWSADKPITARLNATERLSAEDAKRFADAIDSEYSVGETVVPELYAYANILEGK